MRPPPRIVELALVTPAGEPIGGLPPFPVDTPWWPEAAPIVRAARELHGIDVVVLRILGADRDEPAGGAVTYLAETADQVSGVEPWRWRLHDHPLRMPWARPGGPAADLAWADGQLSARGMRRIGPAEQFRTWNLSSLWRLPVDGGTVWLKHVPPFFAHESAMISRLAGGPVPALVAADGPRALMHEIPGEDMYDAGLQVLAQAVPMLVELQHDWMDRVDDLVAMNLPDWRPASLAAQIVDVLDRTGAELSADDRSTLARFAAELPARFARLEACGIPNSLVHGDFSPGNLRGDEASVVLLDWGDSGIGHPLLDQPAMLDRAPADAVEPLRETWVRAWEAALPGCDPREAARLLSPIAAARQAVIYRKFLDNIEPSEQPYHRADPGLWLGRAATLARSPEFAV